MARSVDPTQSFEFILEADRDLPKDHPDRTVWTLKPLGANRQMRIQDKAAQLEGDSLQVNSGTTNLMTFRRGLLGVEKFPDCRWKEGDPEEDRYIKLELEKKSNGEMVVPIEFCDRVRQVDRTEIADAITSGGRLDAELAGKS